MDQKILDQMMAMAEAEDAAELSVKYLENQLRTFLKTGERVLICFSNARVGGLGWIMEQAVVRCGGVPLIWGPDYRWKTVLQQAFFNHVTVIMAPPLIVLGLSKLKKHTGLPLYIRHAFTAGYPCLDWMMEGIVKGLDCTIQGCFGFGETGILAGVSCPYSKGVHIREDVYAVDICDENGTVLPDGQRGEMVIYPKADPRLRLSMEERACRLTDPCKCGSSAPRLEQMGPGKKVPEDLIALGQQLHSWTSVLDCWLKRGPYGLELELVVFPGEKLPKLPSAAKQIVRPWDPQTDTPFYYAPTVKNVEFPPESH